MKIKIDEIQKRIRQLNGDGWLFYDVHNRDHIAYKILGINDKKLTSRRWFYFIPKAGTSIKLVHRIENKRLENIPGDTITYLGWQEMQLQLKNILSNSKKIFMQYSPLNNIPTISYADAGMVELIRSFNIEVLSSANLIQFFENQIDEYGISLHRKAGEKIQIIKDMAFNLIISHINSDKIITEYDVQKFILAEFEKENLTCEGIYPIVAANSHAADPHFELTKKNSTIIKKNDRVLIDLWAKENMPNGIYYDITWCGYMGLFPPEEYSKLFNIVVHARDAAKNFIIERLKKEEPILGWEVDKVARDHIKNMGYGEYFIHRTGHSIHTSVHGNGANLDNLETKDDREIIPGSCFSIEPGIYKNGIGVRSEINVIIDYQKNLIIVGPEQQDLVLIK
ncbi:M24 family metallopeptidase [Candidatus Desantisbacteria bacterium]|nr:M24 family metallopeptidase [Candidatus Desantisbacteria bacterium]